LQDWDGFTLYAYARHNDLATDDARRPAVQDDPQQRNRMASRFFDSYCDASRWSAFALGAAIFLGKQVAAAPHLVELGICGQEAYRALQEVPDDPVLAAAHIARVQRRFFAATYPPTAVVGVFRGPAGEYPVGKPSQLYQPGKMLRQTTDGGGSVGNAPAAAVYDDPWYAQIAGALAAWLAQPQLAQALNNQEWLSETGELRREFGKGRFSVTAPNCLVVGGEGGNSEMSAGALRVRIANDSIVVALLSLDGHIVAQSDDLLVAIVPDGQYGGQTLKDGWLGDAGRLPMQLETVTGDIYHTRLAALPNIVAYDASMARLPGPAGMVHEGERLTLHNAHGAVFLRFSTAPTGKAH
jgi:hypothetical protein